MEFKQDKAAPAALFLTEETSCGGCVKSLLEEMSESSSSVVVSGESSEEDNDDGVSSQAWFGSSLEDSLPIKRGLSNYYIGKSKSFGNLIEASKVKDLEKVESALNKRRRLIIANKLRRRSSLSSFSIYSKTKNLRSMPLLALQESDEENHNYSYDKDNDNDGDDSSDEEISKLQEKRMKMTMNNRDFMVQTHSCFSLTKFKDDDR